jgi:hypothetical protein
MHGGFISNLGMGWSLVIVMTTLIVTIVIIVLIVGATKGWFNKPSTPDSSSSNSSTFVGGFSLTGTPSGCTEKLGCVDTSITLTATPDDIASARGGKFLWVLNAYTHGGRVLTKRGLTAVSAFGNTTTINVVMGDGTVPVNSAQVKVTLTKGSETGAIKYYNYSV